MQRDHAWRGYPYTSAEGIIYQESRSQHTRMQYQAVKNEAAYVIDSYPSRSR